MKVKITLLVIQYNRNKNYISDDYTKIFFTKDNKFPSCFCSTKDEKEVLKSIFSKHFKVDYGWFEKQLYDFRVVNNNGDITAETVYISYVPEVIDIAKSGKFLTFSQINEKEIKLEPFYERGIIGAGRSTFR